MPDNMLQRLDLTLNPFEPAATGPPIGIQWRPPLELEQRMTSLQHKLQTAAGPKVVVIIGEYGTGKTCLLRWLHEHFLPERRIKSFYFDNPGVHFYDLANRLLRTVGRKDFAKLIWELAGPHVSDAPYQKSFFRKGFEEYLAAESGPRHKRRDVCGPLQEAIISAGITEDEEIAYCLARIVAEAVSKPYFEYRDFLARQQGSVVAENEEAPYFGAILRTLIRGAGAEAVAFLIDEFEEIGLQKKLTKRAAHDYLATLKRLINLSGQEANNFWLFLSMTPDAFDTTQKLEAALIQRVSDDSRLQVGQLQLNDAVTLIQTRLDGARPEHSKKKGLFPFPDDIPFSPTTLANPRRLVQVCFAAISSVTTDTVLPFSEEYLYDIEQERFPYIELA